MSKLRLRHEADKKKIWAEMENEDFGVISRSFFICLLELKTDLIDRSSSVLVLSRRRLRITTTAYARECAYNHIIRLFMTPNVLQSGDRGSFFLFSNRNNSPQHFILHNW